MTEPQIKKLTPQDFLNDFHNFHLKEAVSAKINIEVYKVIISTKGDKHVVQVKQEVIGMDQAGKPIVNHKKITATDALLEEKERLSVNERILAAIRLIEGEKIKELSNG
jgi:hypothetical protein